jgi:hypothetical protein
MHLSDSGYINIVVNRVTMPLHVFLLDRYGVKDGKVIDHINRNRTDNRSSNLRVVSRAENNVNRSKSVNNSSGHVGAFYESGRKGYTSEVYKDGKRVYRMRGLEHLEEAALVHDLAKIYTFNDCEVISLNFENVISKEKYYKLYMDDETLTRYKLDPTKRVKNHPFFRSITSCGEVPLNREARRVKKNKNVGKFVVYIRKIKAMFREEKTVYGGVYREYPGTQGQSPAGTREDEEKRMIRMIKRE